MKLIMENWNRYQSKIEREVYLSNPELLEEGILGDAVETLKNGLMNIFGAPKEFMKIVKLSKANFQKDIVEMEESLPQDEEFMKIINAMAERAKELMEADRPDMIKEMLVRQKQRMLREQFMNEAEEVAQNPLQELMDYIAGSDDPELLRLAKEAHAYHDRKVVDTWESATAKAAGKTVKLPENTKQFLLYVIQTSIGRLIFGIVDNYIMFLVGAVVDAMFGHMFAAAGVAVAMAVQLGMGVGNGISDATGVGVEETLEDDLRDIGLNPDSIDTEDLQQSPGYKSWWRLLNSKGWSMFVIFAGCVLGMFPLFTGPIAGVGIAAAGVGAFKGAVALKKRRQQKEKEKEDLGGWLQSADPVPGS